MSWPEQEIIDTCPYGSAMEAERAGFSACEVCAIPDYACVSCRARRITRLSASAGMTADEASARAFAAAVRLSAANRRPDVSCICDTVPREVDGE